MQSVKKIKLDEGNASAKSPPKPHPDTHSICFLLYLLVKNVKGTLDILEQKNFQENNR